MKIVVKLIGSCGRVDSTSWKIMTILVGFFGYSNLKKVFFVCSVNLKRSHLWNHGAAMGHKTFQSSDPKRDREPPCREHVFFQKLGFDFQEDWMDGVMDCGRCLRATRIQKKTGYHNTVTIYVQRYSHSFEFCQMIFAQSRIG